MVLARDADTPLRDSVEEVDRSVERVDDPVAAAAGWHVVALLPHDAVVGCALAEDLADLLLGSGVGLADRIGRRGLRGDDELVAGAVVLEQHGAGGPRGRLRDPDDLVHETGGGGSGPSRAAPRPARRDSSGSSA